MPLTTLNMLQLLYERVPWEGLNRDQITAKVAYKKERPFVGTSCEELMSSATLVTCLGDAESGLLADSASARFTAAEMCELLQQELEHSILNPQRAVLKAIVSVPLEVFPTFDSNDDIVHVNGKDSNHNKSTPQLHPRPSFFSKICGCFFPQAAVKPNKAPMHHPGAFVGGSYFCCQATSKSAAGCQKGSPKHHSGTYWEKEGWSCCKKKNRNEPGCTEGSHPKPFK